MFTHLDDVEESYFEHFCSAIWVSYELLTVSFKCFIHAFYPDIYTDSVTKKCCDILKFRYNKKDYVDNKTDT